MVCPITPFQVVRIESFIHKQGCFFQMIILCTTNPMLSLKLNVLSYNSIPSGQIEKVIHKQGFFFPDNHFEYQQSYVIFKIEYFIQCQI